MATLLTHMWQVVFCYAVNNPTTSNELSKLHFLKIVCPRRRGNDNLSPMNAPKICLELLHCPLLTLTSWRKFNSFILCCWQCSWTFQRDMYCVVFKHFPYQCLLVSKRNVRSVYHIRVLSLKGNREMWSKFTKYCQICLKTFHKGAILKSHHNFLFLKVNQRSQPEPCFPISHAAFWQLSRKLRSLE